MSIIIAIETSAELASVAVMHEDRIAWRESSGLQTHSQSVLPMIQSLVDEIGIGLARCDAVAFGAGPGSFTGVRTACGVAQGLAFGLDVPVVPVGTLLAMAHACREAEGATDVLAVLDARMDEVYWAQYRYAGGWQAVIEPTLSPASDVIPAGSVLACGNGLAAYRRAFESTSFFPGSLGKVMPHARDIARLGAQAYAEGKSVAARDAQPIYLRNKVALTASERLAKRGS